MGGGLQTGSRTASGRSALRRRAPMGGARTPVSGITLLYKRQLRDKDMQGARRSALQASDSIEFRIVQREGLGAPAGRERAGCREPTSDSREPRADREQRGSQEMGVIGNNSFDCLLLSIHMFRPSCRPMFRPPSLGPP